MSTPTDPRPTDPALDPVEVPVADHVDPATRAEILGRVLAGDVTDREACAQLGVRPTTLARWKLTALEAIEALEGDLDLGPVTTGADVVAWGGDEAAERPVPPTAEDTPAPLTPEPGRAVVHPRVLAAGAIGLLGFAIAAVLITPAASLEALSAINRWLAYASCLLAAGAGVFLWQIHDHAGDADERATLRWWLQAAAIVGVITALAALAFQGAVLAGAGPFAVLDPSSALRAADGALGTSVALRLIGLAYLLYAARTLTSRRTSGVVALVGSGLVIVSFLLIGHSATSEPRWLVSLANLTHTAAAAVWFGGLVLLAITLRHRRRAHDLAGAAIVVGRFSRLAMVSVVVVVLAGVALAAIELPRPTSLVTSAYGLMVLAKLVLVGVVLLVARENHRRIVPDLAAHHPHAWGDLRRTVGVEIGGVVLILLATGLLVSLPQPA